MDLPLDKTEESQEFFSRGIIILLYFLINYSQDVDFTMIYREYETFPIVQFFFFRGRLLLQPRASGLGIQQTFYLLSTELHFPYLPCQFLPQSTASWRSKNLTFFSRSVFP